MHWDSRGHFFGAAAEAMRRILIDRARARGARKRGGGAVHRHLEADLLTLDYTGVGQFADAQATLLEAYPLRSDGFGEDHKWTRTCITRLAEYKAAIEDGD